MKLALGTVQFGLNYGTFNSVGQVGEDEVKRILSYAKSVDIKLLDTAQAYGNSEHVLGNVGAAARFKIVSKIPALDRPQIDDMEWNRIESGVKASLHALTTSQLYGLMLHRGGDLLRRDGDRLWRGLEKLRADGLVQKIGVSVYDVDETQAILDRYPIELIQLPINVLDQRFLSSGVLASLKRREVEIHARSVFLQGLLLTPANKLGSHFDSVQAHLQGYQDYISEIGESLLNAALRFVLGLSEVDHVVVGVLSEAQLSEIVQASGAIKVKRSFERFAWHEQKIVNPSLWK